MIPDRHDKRIKAKANKRKENRKADTKKKRVQDKAKPNLKEPAKKEPRGQIEDKTGYHQLPFKTAAKLYWIPKLTTQEMENYAIPEVVLKGTRGGETNLEEARIGEEQGKMMSEKDKDRKESEKDKDRKEPVKDNDGKDKEFPKRRKPRAG